MKSLILVLTGAAVTVLNNRLYAIGGYDGKTRLRRSVL